MRIEKYLAKAHLSAYGGKSAKIRHNGLECYFSKFFSALGDLGERKLLNLRVNNDFA